MSRFKLWRLRRERKRSGKSYSEYVDKAESADDAQFRICEAMDVRDDIRDKILQLRSLQLQDQAEDLGIPIPAFRDPDSWEDGRDPGTVRLNLKAQLQLKQAIRTEQRENRTEQQEKWSTAAFMLKEIVAPVIGILGAIMGLLSLIHAFRSK